MRQTRRKRREGKKIAEFAKQLFLWEKTNAKQFVPCRAQTAITLKHIAEETRWRRDICKFAQKSDFFQKVVSR